VRHLVRKDLGSIGASSIEVHDPAMLEIEARHEDRVPQFHVASHREAIRSVKEAEPRGREGDEDALLDTAGVYARLCHA